MSISACTAKSECHGDGDCQNSLGADYFCVLGKCKHRSAAFDGSAKDAAPNDSLPQDAAPTDTSPTDTAPTETGVNDTISKDFAPDTSPKDRTPQIGILQLHQPCAWHETAPANQRCAPGFVCVRLDALKAFCFQDCSNNPSVCVANTDDRKNCHQIAWSDQGQPVSICVKFARKEERCEPAQSLHCPPSASSHLLCKDGKCVAATLCQQAGCPCDSNQSPPVECALTKKLLCGPSSRCISGYQAYEGDACHADASLPRVCASGHLCISFDNENQTPRVCLKECDLSKPLTSCAHRPKFACLPLSNNRGACFQDACNVQQDCAFQHPPHFCSGNAGQGRICLPLPFSGPIAFGQACNLSAPSTRCQHPYLCLLTSEGKGFCTVQCADHTNCQSIAQSALCTLKNTAGINFCGWNCDSGQTCPAPLQCQGSFCAAP